MPQGRLIEQYAACFCNRLFLCRGQDWEISPNFVKQEHTDDFHLYAILCVIVTMKGGEKECW